MLSFKFNYFNERLLIFIRGLINLSHLSIAIVLITRLIKPTPYEEHTKPLNSWPLRVSTALFNWNFMIVFNKLAPLRLLNESQKKIIFWWKQETHVKTWGGLKAKKETLKKWKLLKIVLSQNEKNNFLVETGNTCENVRRPKINYGNIEKMETFIMELYN